MDTQVPERVRTNGVAPDQYRRSGTQSTLTPQFHVGAQWIGPRPRQLTRTRAPVRKGEPPARAFPRESFRLPFRANGTDAPRLEHTNARVQGNPAGDRVEREIQCEGNRQRQDHAGGEQRRLKTGRVQLKIERR